jgi:outer membrane immunogenic protein
MKKLIMGAAAFCTVGLADVALAANMPLKAPILVMPPAFSWTGCYIGANGGALWAHKDWSDNRSQTLRTSQDLSSGLAGGQVGCNYQVVSWVFGIQGDFDWTNANATTPDAFGLTIDDNTKIQSLGSVTGRAGYAFNGRFLGYVKGGGAWERDQYAIVTNALALNPGLVVETAAETRPGLTGGLGGEYAITNNLTLFAEYDYYAFGTRTNTLVTATGSTTKMDISERKSVVKAGLNWLFNLGGPAVANH